MKKQTALFGIIAAILGPIIVYTLVGLSLETEEVASEGLPEVTTSCEVDSDCIDLGGTMCATGCTWPMNKESEDMASQWISENKDDGCYLDCSPYLTPTCENNVCVSNERF